MRQKRRLYKLWRFFKKTENIYNYFKKVSLLNNEDALAFSKIFLEEYSSLRTYHFENIDLRFTQVIQNKVAYFPGFHYYKEDEEILMQLGCKPEDVIMWGINYTEDMVKLKKTKWKFLSELKLDHIKAIVNGGYTKDPFILEYFNKRINESS